MLSLLRWGFGTGHEHLTDKERITAAGKRNPHVSGAMVPAQVKRKRGDSTQSLSAQSPHRPTKRGPQMVNLRGGVSLEYKLNGVNDAAVPNGVNSNDNSSLQGSNSAAHNTNARIEVMELDHQPAEPKDNNHAAHGIPPQATNSTDQEAPGSHSMAEISKAQEVITEQFSLEILLKHNELRLIDQEIAKCQVGLEQLRRCSIVPYPSQVGDMANVYAGTGLPLRPAAGNRAPKHPSAWGVTDGPYTRHYSQWLLQDPEFDGGAVDEVPLSARAGKAGIDRRQRGALAEQPSRGQIGRGRRGSAGSRLQALSSGYPPPKEEKGLAIVTRQSDKKLVKLVCMDCGREDFSSAQGFINHCRIAHSRSFASHEAAAQTVGVEVDTPTAESSAPAQTPTLRQEAMTPAPILTGIVHPLNRPGMPNVPTISTPMPKQRTSMNQTPSGPSSVSPGNPPRRVQPDGFSNVPFNPSSQTPHLSRLFAQSGRGGNLDDLVSDAKVKENLNVVESEEDDAEDDSNFEDSDAPPVSHASRAPARTTLRGGIASKSPAPSGRPHSRKGPERATRHPGAIGTPAQRGPEGHARSHQTTLQLSETPPNDLSPHTVESNNAPSLVSDSDDDDYETGNGTSSPSSEAGDEDDEDHIDVDFEVEEVMRDRAGHVHPGVSVTAKSHDPELRTAGKIKAAQRHGFSGVKKGTVTKKRGGR